MQNILATPPSEEVITSTWKTERGHLVSICMPVFNHAHYLKDALNSVLNQKTDFGFEIIVHDDASTDSSAEIIREYSARYPNIVKPILQTINQYSQGIYPTIHFIYPRARLPFIAICEGDDYWTDPSKLQIQVDGMLANPHISFSFHSATGLNYDDTEPRKWVCGDYALADCIIPFHSMLHRIRGMIPCASSVFRQSVKNKLREFQLSRPYLTVGDLYCQYFGSLPNGALFVARTMSAYRFRTSESWTHKTSRNPEFKAHHELAMLRSYFELDEITGYQYQDSFNTLALQRIFWLFNPASPPETTPHLEALSSIHDACQCAYDEELDRLRKRPAQYLILGCASGCRMMLKTFPASRITAIIDRDNRRGGEDIDGIPIINTDEISNFPGCEMIISPLWAHRESTIHLASNAGIRPEHVHFVFAPPLDAIRTYRPALQTMLSNLVPTHAYQNCMPPPNSDGHIPVHA